MPVRNNASARIVAYVAAHPGCTRAELMAGVGHHDPRWAMPSYCVARGLIYQSGPRSSRRFFPTEELAWRAHVAICAEVVERGEARKRRAWDKQNKMLKTQRQANRPIVSARIKATHRVRREAKAEGLTLAPDVRITIAPPMRDRWAA